MSDRIESIESLDRLDPELYATEWGVEKFVAYLGFARLMSRRGTNQVVTDEDREAFAAHYHETHTDTPLDVIRDAITPNAA